MSNQSYKKTCSFCKQEIQMDMVNGKWSAYNINGGFHQCNGSGQKKQEPIVTVNNKESLSIEQLNARIVRLEQVIEAMVNSAKH